MKPLIYLYLYHTEKLKYTIKITIAHSDHCLLVINSKIKGPSESHAIYDHFFSIFQAFQTFDAEKTNTVTQSEFKRALESFCIPLTEDQFEKLIKKVKI